MKPTLVRPPVRDTASLVEELSARAQRAVDSMHRDVRVRDRDGVTIDDSPLELRRIRTPNSDGSRWAATIAGFGALGSTAEDALARLIQAIRGWNSKCAERTRELARLTEASLRDVDRAIGGGIPS